MNEWTRVPEHQSVVDNIEVVLSQHTRAPEGFIERGNNQPNLTPTNGVFRLSELLSALPNLRMEAGYTLDWVYSLGDLGGHPIVYARRCDVPRIVALDEYKRAHGDKRIRGGKEAVFPSWMAHLIVDDTPQGYLQLLTLVRLGERFYLWWHGNYNDTTVVCTRDAVDAVLKRWDVDRLTPEFVVQARQIDPTPKVVIGDQEVTVSIVCASWWFGFSRQYWTITRTSPHKGVRYSIDEIARWRGGGAL